MKNNEELQKDVQDAIKWEPLLNAAEIGVIVKDGIVTLTGTVDSFIRKTKAEDAAKSVFGVKAVIEQIEVNFNGTNKADDCEIAKEVINIIKTNLKVKDDQVNIKVENGWITLDGVLNWNYQKEALVKFLKNITGVKGVTNDITIKSETNDEIEKEEIERALLRNWAVDSQHIHVNVSGTKVTLSGTVSTLFQKDEAEKITWNTPGVWKVENELIVVLD